MRTIDEIENMVKEHRKAKPNSKVSFSRTDAEEIARIHGEHALNDLYNLIRRQIELELKQDEA